MTEFIVSVDDIDLSTILVFCYSNEDAINVLDDRFDEAETFEDLKWFVVDDAWYKYQKTMEYKTDFKEYLLRRCSEEDFKNMPKQKRQEIEDEIDDSMREGYYQQFSNYLPEEFKLMRFCYWWLQEERESIEGDNTIYNMMNVPKNSYIHYAQGVVNSSQIAWGNCVQQ